MGRRRVRVPINKFSTGPRCLFYCELVLHNIARSSIGKLSTSPECSLFPLIFTNISEHIEHLSPFVNLLFMLWNTASWLSRATMKVQVKLTTLWEIWCAHVNTVILRPTEVRTGQKMNWKQYGGPRFSLCLPAPRVQHSFYNGSRHTEIKYKYIYKYRYIN